MGAGSSSGGGDYDDSFGGRDTYLEEDKTTKDRTTPFTYINVAFTQGQLEERGWSFVGKPVLLSEKYSNNGPKIARAIRRANGELDYNGVVEYELLSNDEFYSSLRPLDKLKTKLAFIKKQILVHPLKMDKELKK